MHTHSFALYLLSLNTGFHHSTIEHALPHTSRRNKPRNSALYKNDVPHFMHMVKTQLHVESTRYNTKGDSSITTPVHISCYCAVCVSVYTQSLCTLNVLLFRSAVQLLMRDIIHSIIIATTQGQTVRLTWS